MDKERAIEVFVTETLKDSVALFLNEKSELSNDDKSLLLSLLSVISYYSVSPDYENFYNKNKQAIDVALGVGNVKSNEFIVSCVTENSDGSADIQVEMGSDALNSVINAGINFALIKVALDGTTDQIYNWALRGKQEENTDKLVNKFGEIYNEDTK